MQRGWQRAKFSTRPSFLVRGRPDDATGKVALAYAMLGTIAVLVALALGHDPIACEAWLGTTGALSVGLSAVLGAATAVATVALTRVVVRRWGWARELHGDLRPAVRHSGDVAIVVMALASGIGEELLFRGLLTPLLGVLLSSLAFGFLHQVRGRARWAWAAWATLMALVFAVTFRLTGSLAGPVIAHVAINIANLRYLRDTEVDLPPHLPKRGSRGPPPQARDRRGHGRVARWLQE